MYPHLVLANTVQQQQVIVFRELQPRLLMQLSNQPCKLIDPSLVGAFSFE